MTPEKKILTALSLYHSARKLKAAALRAFDVDPRAHLIIIVDGSKFIQRQVDHQPVVDRAEWHKLLENHPNHIVLVTTDLAPDIPPNDRSLLDQELKRFDQAGVILAQQRVDATR